MMMVIMIMIMMMVIFVYLKSWDKEPEYGCEEEIESGDKRYYTR